MQVDHFGGLGVDGGQLFQGLVKGKQVLAGRHGRDQAIIQLDSLVTAALFEPALVPRVLDQDATHGPRRRREEVTFSIPAPVAVGTDQAEIGLVNQGGRLKGLSRWLTLGFWAARARSSS